MTVTTNSPTDIPTNTIITGDSLTELKKLPDKSIDLILADLPYGTTDCAWDKCLPLDRLWSEYKRLIKPSAAILLFAQQPFATRLINAAGRMFRYQIVWEKEKSVGFLNANKMPLRAHEMILVFYNRLPTYNPQMSPGKPYVKKDKRRGKLSVYRANRCPGKTNAGWRYPRDVIKFPQPSSAEGRFHPTQKPLALLEYLIKTYAVQGWTNAAGPWMARSGVQPRRPCPGQYLRLRLHLRRRPEHRTRLHRHRTG